MGCQHSAPVRTSDVRSTRSFFGGQICHSRPDNFLTSKIQGAGLLDDGCHLKIKRNVWTTTPSSDGCCRCAIQYCDGRPFEANIASIDARCPDRLVLINQQQEPIGLILNMSGMFEQSFLIYGVKPFYVGQQPSQETLDDGRLLYEWCRVDSSMQTFSRCVLTTIDGVTYESSHIDASSCKNKKRHGNQDSRETSLIKMTRNGMTCAKLEQEIGLFGIPFWDTMINPGIDPCLMICFTICVDKLMQQAHEIQHETQSYLHEEFNNQCDAWLLDGLQFASMPGNCPGQIQSFSQPIGIV